MYFFLPSFLRYILIMFGIVTLIACQSGNANQPNQGSPPKHPKDKLEKLKMNENLIQLELTADPLQLSMSKRKDFKISIKATNHSNELIDPQLHEAELFVNSQRSVVWSLAISNGRREAKWSALPPRETVSMTWSSMGASLFPAPGDYTLVLHYGETQLDPIHVHVLP